MGLYDAVPVPSSGMGKPEVIRLLRERFPEFAHLFANPDNFDPEDAEPYYSYNRLMDEVLARKEDKALRQRVSFFINELILSKDSWPEELAGEVLESLAQDASLATELYSSIVPKAQQLLKAMARI